MILLISPLQITCSGPSIMTGYRKNKAANEEVFYQHNGERYFRTGDMGRMVEGKFLKLTGRIKEQFKLENGKYVVPAPLEDVYCRSPYIAQMFLTGMNHPNTIVLIVPNYANLALWYEKQGKVLKSKMPTQEELTNPDTKHLATFDEPAFVELITSEVSKICSQFDFISVLICVKTPFLYVL
jgi:long-subunit acyl-CoA synthetase (AMP-forming)